MSGCIMEVELTGEKNCPLTQLSGYHIKVHCGCMSVWTVVMIWTPRTNHNPNQMYVKPNTLEHLESSGRLHVVWGSLRLAPIAAIVYMH